MMEMVVVEVGQVMVVPEQDAAAAAQIGADLRGRQVGSCVA
jgi:hypothetical protein